MRAERSISRPSRSRMPDAATARPSTTSALYHDGTTIYFDDVLIFGVFFGLLVAFVVWTELS